MTIEVRVVVPSGKTKAAVSQTATPNTVTFVQPNTTGSFAIHAGNKVSVEEVPADTGPTLPPTE